MNPQQLQPPSGAPTLDWKATDNGACFFADSNYSDGQFADPYIWQLDLAEDAEPGGAPAWVVIESSPQLLPDGDLPEWETAEAARAWCEERDATLIRKAVARA